METDHKRVKELADEYGVPQKVIRRMIEKGMFSSTIDCDMDIQTLECIKKIWCDIVLLRAQLATMTIQRRRRIVETAHLNKWEQYACSDRATKISATDLAAEIKGNFGVALTPAVRARIRQLQKKARNARDYQAKKKAKKKAK